MSLHVNQPCVLSHFMRHPCMEVSSRDQCGVFSAREMLARRAAMPIDLPTL